MKALCAAVLLCILSACTAEKTEPAKPAAPPSATVAQETAPPAAPVAPPSTTVAQETAEPAVDAEKGVWPGQLRIDAHAGTATLEYVGAESGDYVPLRFRIDSAAGRKILEKCADEDLCEVEGSVQFLDEPPPENASAVGNIVAVTRVKKLPPQ